MYKLAYVITYAMLTYHEHVIMSILVAAGYSSKLIINII